MFHNIDPQILERMQHLERLDAADRKDGTPRMQRLRQIPPLTGQFIAQMAACAPDGNWIEIGTSAGYSTLWLALACRELGKKITTFEILPEKARLAQETFRLAAVENEVELIHGDALAHLPKYKNISFCFLDAEKEIYRECYEIVIPNMVRGGLLIADNAINHRAILQPMIEHALQDKRIDACVLPIGMGELMCRKI